MFSDFLRHGSVGGLTAGVPRNRARRGNVRSSGRVRYVGWCWAFDITFKIDGVAQFVLAKSDVDIIIAS